MDNEEELFPEEVEEPSGFKTRLPKAEPKLKPITMHTTSGKTGTKFEDNKAQQVMLLSALQVTRDPKKLKEMIGVRTVAEVYRTLDKMAIRREFHTAFDRAGITFDFIINGIKREAIAGDKSADRLKAFELMMKSLGLDKYDDVQASSGSSWEDKLVELMGKQEPGTPSLTTGVESDEEYEVKEPEIPASALARQEEEEKMGASIFNDYPKP